MAGADPTAGSLEPVPAAAARILGDRLEVMTRYAQLLAGDGVLRGLIGPREAPRLWERHLLNCVVVGELLPEGARLVDVGSGAGLPGLALACAREDLDVVLVDPLERRTAFLEEAAASLGLADRVVVLRGRIDDAGVRRSLGRCEWMTARAVAPLARLAEWCAPALSESGRLLAMKGDRAAAEILAARGVLRKLKLVTSVRSCGGDLLDQPTRVVVVERDGR